MKIHEYQAKAIFNKYGIPTPKGEMVETSGDAQKIAEKLIGETGSDTVVVKAQIHAGGRGKGGGVKVVKGADEAFSQAQTMLGMKLVTHQTTKEGQVVRRLLVEQGMNKDDNPTGV